jgi:hypothetical protein
MELMHFIVTFHQCNNWKNGLFRWVSLMNLSNSWLIFWLNRNRKDGVNECYKSDDSVLNLLFEYSTRWKLNLYTNKRARRESITGETHPNILLHHNSVRHTQRNTAASKTVTVSVVFHSFDSPSIGLCVLHQQFQQLKSIRLFSFLVLC